MSTIVPRRRAALALLLACTAVLGAGCVAPAPAPPPRVIAFGDSLSDLGTSADLTRGRTAARYTTNPGPVWVELVAQALGTTISANRHMPAAGPPVLLGGNGYAEGGARVAHDAANRPVGAVAPPAGLQRRPVREQVGAWLAEHAGRFEPRDLVLVWAGGNEIFHHAFAAPAASAAAGEAAVRQAARDLAGEVRRVLSSGAPRVVVLTIDDYGEAPVTLGSPKRPMLSAWTRAFNEQLAAGLADARVVLVDAGGLLRAARRDPARFGLKDGSGDACDLKALPKQDVLFCDQHTLVDKDAHLTHLYADGNHPTTAGHRLIAQAVLERLRR